MNKKLESFVSAADFSFFGIHSFKRKILFPLLALLAPTTGYAASTNTSSSQPLSPSQPSSIQSVIEHIEASTVVIYVKLAAGGTATGTGWSFDDKGDINTDAHVVAAPYSEISVVYNGVAYPGVVMGSDNEADVAVLHIPYKKIPPLKWGDSDNVSVTEYIVKVGNLQGLGLTPSTGMVTGIDRFPSDKVIVGLDQDDSPSSEGDSGAAVVDGTDQVIAVAEQVGVDDLGSQIPGVSFDTPSNIVKRAVDDILKYGKVIPATHISLLLMPRLLILPFLSRR